jgi:magnesium and cobalt transporter
MSELSSMQLPSKKERGLLERLSSLLLREPEDRDQLLEVLQQAHERNLLDAEALSMIEGVMQVSDLSARDIMVPRAQMDVINVEDSIGQIVAFAVEKAHSRFPVFDGERNNIIGVLLAKDLLRAHADSTTNLHDLLRPALFIPESKRLNVLLHDFRLNRNHIALVVDEYGGVAGLVTIEDVLEQIVGDIEDEYDFDEDADNIIALDGHLTGNYRVKALTTIEQFNLVFGTEFSNENADTLGGLLTEFLSRLPQKGEVVDLPPMRFEILRADSRLVHLLKVQRIELGSGEIAEQNLVQSIESQQIDPESRHSP